MPTATLLLPAAARLIGQGLPADVAKALGRADRDRAEAGERAQLRRHFRLVPDHWPVAALTRGLDAGDAAGATWLRADPAFIRPDLNGARMLSHGEALELSGEDAAQLLQALKPLFGDAGFPIDAPDPSRWYLRLPLDAQLPAFAPPEDALGDDLFAHLPQGDAGRRWRALLTEAQVILHAHPWNARRLGQGKAAVNSLWFWGAGRLPDSVQTPFKQVKSNEPLLRALAKAAGVGVGAAGDDVDALVDLRHLRSMETLGRDTLRPLFDEVAGGRLDALHLDFEDGARFALNRGQRWRFWRRPLTGFASKA
ncbi:MAG: phosphoglycerate mutase [Pseudoxanthomonas sp.]